jgi:hypothetical protein
LPQESWKAARNQETNKANECFFVLTAFYTNYNHNNESSRELGFNPAKFSELRRDENQILPRPLRLESHVAILDAEPAYRQLAFKQKNTHKKYAIS